MTSLPVQRIGRSSASDLDPRAWPCTLPAVRQVLDRDLELDRLTVLVGENGSGKSTLVEAIAMAFGMSPEGGSTGARHSTRATESELWKAITLTRGIGSPRWGFFLRAETMHGFYTYLEDHPSPHDPSFHEMSHGESFLEVITRRIDGPGLYVFDEPESALSFTGCLALAERLNQIARSEHSQAIVATHSPILAAVPGATIYELTDAGLQRSAWEDLELVDHWRTFLHNPHTYFRYLFDD